MLHERTRCRPSSEWPISDQGLTTFRSFLPDNCTAGFAEPPLVSRGRMPAVAVTISARDGCQLTTFNPQRSIVKEGGPWPETGTRTGTSKPRSSTRRRWGGGSSPRVEALMLEGDSTVHTGIRKSSVGAASSASRASAALHETPRRMRSRFGARLMDVPAARQRLRQKEKDDEGVRIRAAVRGPID